MQKRRGGVRSAGVFNHGVTRLGGVSVESHAFMRYHGMVALSQIPRLVRYFSSYDIKYFRSCAFGFTGPREIPPCPDTRFSRLKVCLLRRILSIREYCVWYHMRDLKRAKAKEVQAQGK